MKWIKCSEQMPDDCEFCLVFHKDDKCMDIAVFRGDSFAVSGDCELQLNEVTHWMPLPEVPKDV